MQICKLFAVIFATAALSGCAHFSSVQTDTLADGTVRQTRVRVVTVFDAHNDLAKLRASTTDKTQGVSLAGLDQNSSSTNAVEVLRLIAQIVGTVAK
jgi:hypothetical protein